jgi:hypothetical protein
MVAGCASTDWSAVASAPANTALAGVLAGFMINGIVLLLSTTPGASQRSGYVQGAALLFSALVALGLDAYLFGLVTGDTAASACRRAWTEAMFAAGLLGLGAVAVIVAIVFLLGVFFWDTPAAEESEDSGSADAPSPPRAENADVNQKNALAEKDAMVESKKMLATLCMWLRPGVAVVVVLFLWVSARSYVSSIFNGGPPHWATILLTILLIVDYVIILVFAFVYWAVSSKKVQKRATGQVPAPESRVGNRTPGWFRSKLEVHSLTLSKVPILNLLPGFLNWVLEHQQYDFIRFRLVNGILNLTWEGLLPDQSGKTTTLKVAVFAASGYSLLSAFFAGFVIYGPASFWNSSGFWVNSAFVAIIIWVLVGALVPLGALLAPTFGPRIGKAATRSDP